MPASTLRSRGLPPAAALAAAILLLPGAGSGGGEPGTDGGLDGGGGSAPTVPSCRPGAPAKRFKTRFGPGEAVYYIVTLKDVPVGKAVLKTTGVVTREGRKALHTVAKGRTNSFFSNVHKIRAVVEQDTLMPSMAPRSYDEDFRHQEKTYRAVYEYRGPGGVDLQFDLDGRKSKERLGAAGVNDFVSALYNVRTMPLVNGDSVCLDVLYYRHVWRLSGSVRGRERVQTPAGFFDAVLLSGEAVRMDDPKRRKRVSVWLTDDEYRIPIRAVSDVSMGETAVTATYVRRSGGGRGTGIEAESREKWWSGEEAGR